MSTISSNTNIAITITPAPIATYSPPIIFASPRRPAPKRSPWRDFNAPQLHQKTLSEFLEGYVEEPYLDYEC